MGTVNHILCPKDRFLRVSSYDQAREAVYGEPYDDWKAKHQLPASDAQKAAYEKSAADHADIRGDF